MADFPELDDITLSLVFVPLVGNADAASRYRGNLKLPARFQRKIASKAKNDPSLFNRWLALKEPIRVPAREQRIGRVVRDARDKVGGKASFFRFLLGRTKHRRARSPGATARAHKSPLEMDANQAWLLHATVPRAAHSPPVVSISGVP